MLAISIGRIAATKNSTSRAFAEYRGRTRFPILEAPRLSKKRRRRPESKPLAFFDRFMDTHPLKLPPLAKLQFVKLDDSTRVISATRRHFRSCMRLRFWLNDRGYG